MGVDLALERLELHARRKLLLLFQSRRRHLGGQQAPEALGDRLLRLADVARVAVVELERAQDVVGFPALGGDGAVAQVCQQLLEHRHLLGQFLRHAVAGGLVAVVHFVPEGGSLQVKGHGHLVGLALLEQGEQDIQKAVNRIGIAAVLGGQQLDAKKGAVGNAVAVNDQ